MVSSKNDRSLRFREDPWKLHAVTVRNLYYRRGWTSVWNNSQRRLSFQLLTPNLHNAKYVLKRRAVEKTGSAVIMGSNSLFECLSVVNCACNIPTGDGREVFAKIENGLYLFGLHRHIVQDSKARRETRQTILSLLNGAIISLKHENSAFFANTTNYFATNKFPGCPKTAESTTKPYKTYTNQQQKPIFRHFNDYVMSFSAWL